MKIIIAAAAALALLAAPLPALADNGCFGCNVRDAGAFDERLVGETVYVEAGAGDWGRVVRVSRRTGRAQLRMSNGDLFETTADNLYSRASRSERTNATIVGISAIAMIAVCVMGACGDDQESVQETYDPDADVPELEGAP
jgi:hypothetical protein